jgi:hypothetical protein
MRDIRLNDCVAYIGQPRYDFTHGKKYKILEISYDDKPDIRYWIRDDKFEMRCFSKSSNLVPNFFILTNELRKQKLKNLKLHESSL